MASYYLSGEVFARERQERWARIEKIALGWLNSPERCALVEAATAQNSGDDECDALFRAIGADHPGDVLATYNLILDGEHASELAARCDRIRAAELARLDAEMDAAMARVLGGAQ